MENGRITDWDAMGHVWDYTFKEKMKINPSDSYILLTEPPNNPVENRRKMITTMFEKYNFKGVYVAIQAILTLYAQGLMTGVVVDSGDGVTHIVPVCEGYPLPYNFKRLDVAGREVTRYLMKLLLLRGYVFNSSADTVTIQEMKEKLCYAAYDLASEEKLAENTTAIVAKYQLPDGRNVTLSRERYLATECLFNPHLLDIDQEGMSKSLYSCIESCDVDLRTPLRSHIVLSGGTTMYPGLPSRLEKDMNDMYKKSHPANPPKVAIEDPPRRKHMVFLGGAVLANVMANQPVFWVTREEYKEKGAQWCTDKSLGTLKDKK
jgi:actin-related protein 2